MPELPPTRASLLARLNDPADQAAWEEFVAAYGPPVLSEARRRGFGHADGEDLTQRVFTRVFRGLKSFAYDPARGRFRDWLGTILRHEVIRNYRAQARKPVTYLPTEDLDAAAGAAPDPEWVDAFQVHVYNLALDRCRPRFQPATWAAFELVWAGGLSAAAAATGLSVDSVYVAKSRVLAALSQTIHKLTDELPLFPDDTRQ